MQNTVASNIICCTQKYDQLKNNTKPVTFYQVLKVLIFRSIKLVAST